MFRIKSIIIGLILLFSFAAPVSLQAENLGPQQLVVNVPGRTITLYAGDSPIKEYPVAVGKTSTPTPLGNFSIISKEVNPAWYPPERPGQVVPPGPYNPLGRRWMGFIANNYGIHGTNDPGSIGLAVTNGCLRMRNTDAEELFELVGYNTPVKITYDLTRVFTDEYGQVKISIYPDIYGRGKAETAALRNILERYGLSPFVADDYLATMLAESAAKPVDIVKTAGLKINGEAFDGQVIITRENTYIPLKAVSGALTAISSGEGGQQADFLSAGGKEIPIFSFNNIAYVSGGDIEKLLPGRQSWQEDGFLSLERTIIFYNGQKTSLGTIKINEILALPLKDLAVALNRTGRWDETSRTFYLENAAGDNPVQIKPDMAGPEPFIAITRINEYFDAYVYWDIQNNTVELTCS